jgi:hypothetical protein
MLTSTALVSYLLPITSIVTAHPIEGSSQPILPRGEVLYPLRKSLWPIRDIPVCWEPLGGANDYTTEKSWVQESVNAEWGGQGNMAFHGWDVCGPEDRGIRIAIRDKGPHTLGLGTSLDGIIDGMVLNFEFNTPNFQGCKDTRESCIRSIGVHEFGHALGFAHEQNRPDTPKAICIDEPQGTDGDWLATPWDLSSVMNYCNSVYNGDGLLSDLDKQGFLLAYPVPV